MLQQQLPTAANTYPAKEYRLTLAKTNSGFVGKLNNDKEEMLFLPDILNVQNDRMYVGFYTAREAGIEVSNIEFKVTAAKTDAPRVNPPAEPITPHLEILSPDRTSLTNYRLAYRANVDGFISVKKGR